MRRTHGCPRCAEPATAEELAESAHLPGPVRDVLGPDGACSTCAQQALRDWLQARVVAGGADGVSPYHDAKLIPFGVLPIPWQLGLPPRFTGRGVTLAMIDSGFYPHPELTGVPDEDASASGTLRLRAWADASSEPVKCKFFHPLHPPRWPGWSRREAVQWHGTMTAGAAAGDGRDTRGWYAGVAPGADLVFVQCWDANGRITNASLARAMRWLRRQRERLRLRVVNVSVYGDPLNKLKGNYVDAAVRHLVEDGVVVVTAAGNSATRGLVPPATSAHAITVGGVDPRNSPDPAAWRMWRGNWGRSSSGTRKPDLLAPSDWLPAPILPGSLLAVEARDLFDRRETDPTVEERIRAQKLIAPTHQHVDGTSFGSAIVAGLIACMIEAKPALTPSDVRQALVETATPLPDVPASRQGAGVVRAAAALSRVLNMD